MAVTYFGGCDSAGAPSGTASNNDNGITFWRAYTCPGTGNQVVTLLESDIHTAAGNTVLRLAIYNSAGTSLLAQGNSATITNTGADAWSGGAVSGITLVGGTNYILAWTVAGVASGYSDHADDTRSYGSYKFAEYTGGFPASLPSADGSYLMYPIRCGVEPAAGGGAAGGIMLLMDHFDGGAMLQ